jgi:ketosteroid isomerase-like protein
VLTSDVPERRTNLSTAPATDVRALDADLNKRISAGDILGAFDTYYDDNVVMQENATEPRVGKATNRKYEEQFLASVEKFHGATLLGSAVSGDLSYSEWEFDATYKGAGRVKQVQVAARRWKNGKVVNERFYYNKG